MQASLANIAPSMGRIYIYRTTVAGGIIQPKIYVNDVEVGSAIPRGFFYVDRPPGNYQIRMATEVKRTLSLTLSPGQIRYVKLKISLGFFVGHVYGELVENEVGEAEIQKLRYTGKSQELS
jgi:hypothetical protein